VGNNPDRDDEAERAALEEARRAFSRFAGRPPLWGARAPGRVNLIGEHTDYNGGLVLPCAIDRHTVVWGAPRSDGRVRVRSWELGEEATLEARAPIASGTWSDYVAGVFQAALRAGAAPPGMDLAISSRVPGGAGLSSSAALEVAVATLLDAALGAGWDGATRARLAHQAETAFVGVACGLMDQLASALGRAGHALRIDCQDLAVRPVALPPTLALLVVDSGVRHALADGDYGRRRRECEAALAAAREAGLCPRDAATLRALGPAALPALARVADDVPLRRARHVLSENARVDAVVAALEQGDLAAAGAALRAGMASLRDDFEVSTPELDALCALGDATAGVHGSRLTGAGFGGCTLHLVDAPAADAARHAIARGFAARFGRTPRSWLVRAAAGAAPLAP